MSCVSQLRCATQASAIRRGNDILLVLYLCFDISPQFKTMTVQLSRALALMDRFITSKSCVEADNLDWYSSAS
jgi:hypothetical protein